MGTAIHANRIDAGYSIRQTDTLNGSGVAPVTICVDNLSHILSAYGTAAAKAALATVDLILDQLRMGGCLVEVHRPGLFEISFGHLCAAEAARVLELLLDRLSCEPVRCGDLRFHLSLDCLAQSEAGQAPLIEQPARDLGSWAENYHDDMQIAVNVIAALAEGRLHMSWQPVRSADTPEHVLYSEGLARIVGNDGQFISPALFIPALERLGLARAFDRQILAWTLDELESFPAAILGVNISGQSAQLDGWWASLFDRLGRAPDVAGRLVVEITETAAPSVGVYAFVSELHKLGSRVALDDFGVGHASIRHAMTFSPDIIKIDAFFLRRAGLAERSEALLEHLIGLAGSLAPIVIVEGVENEAQSRLAARLQDRSAPRSQGCWQQGYHFGKPTEWRGWRFPEGQTQVVPMRNLTKVPGAFRARESYVGLGRF